MSVISLSRAQRLRKILEDESLTAKDWLLKIADLPLSEYEAVSMLQLMKAFEKDMEETLKECHAVGNDVARKHELYAALKERQIAHRTALIGVLGENPPSVPNYLN